MARKWTTFILIVSVLWWVFPDFFPGPIDDLVAFVVTVITSINLIATKAKATQEAVALLTPESVSQSS